MKYSLRVHSIFNQLLLKNILYQIPTLVFVTITVYQCLFTYISLKLSTFSHILNYLPQNTLLIAQKLPINFWNVFPHLLLWSYLIFQKDLKKRFLVQVRLLAMSRGELSAVIALLMSKCL